MIEKIKARWAALHDSAKRGIVAGSVFFALLLLTLWAGSCAKVFLLVVACVARRCAVYAKRWAFILWAALHCFHAALERAAAHLRSRSRRPSPSLAGFWMLWMISICSARAIEGAI